MFKKGKIVLVVALMLAFSNISYAESYSVPEGRTIDAALNTQVDASTCTLGGHVEAVSEQPFYDDGNYVLPAGTLFEGKITFVDNVNSAVKINFYTIVLPDNTKIPISAMIETQDGTGILKYQGSSKFNSFKKAFTAIGSGAAISAAKSAIIKEVIPGAIRQTVAIAKTAQAGVGIVKDAKDGDYKTAGVQTAEQVVKYTPYGMAYGIGKSAVKGYDSYKQQQGTDSQQVNTQSLVLQPGTKLEIEFLAPFSVKN